MSRTKHSSVSFRPGLPGGRPGMVLVVVLVVIAFLSLGAGTFCELMLCEREAAQMSARQIQARALAESAIEMTRSFLAWDEQSMLEAGGLYNNTQRFQAVPVIDDVDAYERGRFAVVAPLLADGLFGGIRFGLEDESTRLNLNALTVADQYGENTGRDLLMALPGMTEDVADSILDWLDTDEDVREFGAENEYYQALDPPYSCGNGPLGTIEELLLVRGVTPALLFGVDANRNGYAETSEPDPLLIAEVDNSDGAMNQGWAAYLTLHSMELNVRPDGSPKIDVNQEDMETLYDELEEALGSSQADFIVAYRQFGPTQSRTNPVGSLPGSLDLSRPGNEQLTTVLDLIDARVEVPQEGSNETTVLESPFSAIAADTSLSDLVENVTAQSSTVIPGRINVNQASSVVLAGIPGMTDEIVDQIVGQREPDPVLADPQRLSEIWLLAEGIVTLEEMKKLAPLVTGGGSVYRAQAIGYFDRGGPTARFEVVLDATANPARVLSWKDISHLGPGYPKEILGIE